MSGASGARFVLEGRSTDDGGAIRLTVADGVIAAIERRNVPAPADWIAPGWIDLQVNGFEGHDPNAVGVSPDATIQMVRALWHHGVTAVCPTIITNAEPHMLAALRAVDQACAADPLVAASIPGIHVEGPHIATEDTGIPGIAAMPWLASRASSTCATAGNGRAPLGVLQIAGRRRA